MSSFQPTCSIYSFIYLLQIEDRLFVDYQALKEVTVPLRDVMDYEANNNNDSDVTYQRLLYVQEQLNTSLEQLENMVSKHYIQ